jgi:hypothetical protein
VKKREKGITFRKGDRENRKKVSGEWLLKINVKKLIKKKR